MTQKMEYQKGRAMNKKYKLGESKHFGGNINTTLYRVIALTDIPRYGVHAGDVGGWIQDESCLSQEGDKWIDKESKIWNGGWAVHYGEVVERDSTTIKIQSFASRIKSPLQKDYFLKEYIPICEKYGVSADIAVTWLSEDLLRVINTVILMVDNVSDDFCNHFFSHIDLSIYNSKYFQLNFNGGWYSLVVMCSDIPLPPKD